MRVCVPVVVLETVEAGESCPAVVAHVIPGAGHLGAASLPLPTAILLLVVLVAALEVGVTLEFVKVAASTSKIQD